ARQRAERADGPGRMPSGARHGVPHKQPLRETPVTGGYTVENRQRHVARPSANPARLTHLASSAVSPILIDTRTPADKRLDGLGACQGCKPLIILSFPWTEAVRNRHGRLHGRMVESFPSAASPL